MGSRKLSWALLSSLGLSWARLGSPGLSWALLCSHGLSKVGPKIATIGFGFWQAQKVDKGLLLKFKRFDHFCVQIDSRVFRQVEIYHFAT